MRFRQIARYISTGLVGLPRVKNPREVLLSLYQRTLEELKELPEISGYNQVAQATTEYRMKIVQEHTDIETIEKKIDCGVIEEVICQAEDELNLVPVMKEAKVWEPRQ